MLSIVSNMFSVSNKFCMSNKFSISNMFSVVSSIFSVVSNMFSIVHNTFSIVSNMFSMTNKFSMHVVCLWAEEENIRPSERQQHKAMHNEDFSWLSYKSLKST